ncbi:calcineurin-like phosphoesterase family protein [Seonamhaeicola aphaedonensis]|uniref:Calcineurin-like phosphoesterase family protein n=2 Tax=Seonamhaeicola aphaedonensis TaxID=1461338 RepID=A0A3D9HER0_9FLAO|nr:calcineurin-like phosphoesterase family protein [Seonamhaeicola aphaedonensis]
MADVHFQDIYGSFSDSDYKGVLNPETNTYTLARTMQSQLQSTRLFNENYFAFLSALDDIVSKNIKYVVLPGDFSDDGQMFNIKGLKHILKKYSEKHNIKFILTTGNHDPVRPFYQEAGKYDFIGEGGKQQPIFSSKEIYRAKDSNALEPVFTKDIAKLGYEDILNELKDFGFYPKQNDVYWETPFIDYNYENYQFDKALKQAELSNRNYKIPPFGSQIPDVSYLVEPTEGLWFLAIDANVYVPKDANSYSSASVGYNNILSHKAHLMAWIKSVTQRAKKLNKKLIVFSHFPTVEFNDGASENIRMLLGDDKMQLHRVPEDAVAKAFIEAGVKVHFGGHMHINDTGVTTFESGSLVNVQIPSLAAYIPAYKIATVSADEVEIETVVIDNVHRFKEFFPLYKQEYAFMKSKMENVLWDSTILNAKTYKDLTQSHLKGLINNRFLEKDWDIPFTTFLLSLTKNSVAEFVSINENTMEGFEDWTGFEMLFDLYRLRSADTLAFQDIGEKRVEIYKKIIEAYLIHFKSISAPSEIENDFLQFCLIFKKFLNGAPSDNFIINLNTNQLISK